MAQSQLKHFETLALHAGYEPKKHNNASTVPIYQTAAYEYNSAEHAAKLFALEEFGNIYTRIGNPTTAVLEKRITALHGGVGALAVASGHAAQFIAITNIAEKGDNILSSSHLYGGTFNQFKVTFKKLGVETRFFNPEDISAIEHLTDKKTKAVYLESLGNPAMDVPDFEKISQITKKLKIPLIVDNTFLSAALFKPFEFGANIVVESLTKYVGGTGSSLGGVIVDGGNFDWGKTNKFSAITEPCEGYHGLNFFERFGKEAFIVKARVDGLRDFGPALSPTNAFYFLQGLETLSLRMERHSENALKLAEFLESHSQVRSVNYPGLRSSKYFKRAQKYFPKGCSGMLNFELQGGLEAGKNFLESVKIAQHQTNLGDNKTIVTHPASTTHQQLTEKEREASGITAGMIRVSAGIEHIKDLIEDFQQAIIKSSSSRK